MTSLYDTGTGFHIDIEELGRKLQVGDGIHWAGDPDLDLHVGIVCAKRAGIDKAGIYRRAGDVVARRYEVWRHCEDGADRMIGHWRLEERDQIIMDVARMRGALEGRAQLAEDEIDTNNAAIEQAKADEYLETAYPLLEHALELDHDRTEGKNVFRQVGGFRDDESVTAGKTDAP